MQSPVIVIPGITATSLVDHYPVNGDRIWSMVFDKEYERVARHPDDLRYEAIEPAHVLAGKLIPVYDDLIKALRHELSPRADPRNMQESIEDTLTEFVRLYAVDTRASKRREKAAETLRSMLNMAFEHRQTVMKFRTALANMTQSDWLVIIGVGQRTRLQLTVTRDRRGPRFVIDENQLINELDASRPDSQRTGDGTVPLAGAVPPFLPATKPVCVVEPDLGLFELRDRLLVEIGGFHGLLPRVNLVQRLVTKHLLPTYRGEVWGRRLPGSQTWNPPIDGLAEKSY